MTILIGLLTVVLILDCLFLVLLVLVQLPKKEAGAGLAFGGGTSDAIFGAGSGNALTKITKYAAGGFLGLTLIISVLTGMNRHRASDIDQKLQEASKGAATAPAAVTPSAVPTAPLTAPVTAPAPTEPAAAPAATPAPDSTTATPK